MNFPPNGVSDFLYTEFSIGYLILEILHVSALIGDTKKS